MKTLNEVIRGFECCNSINCAECPYANWSNTDVVRCDPTDKDDDALHYLKTIETTENLYHDAVNELSKWKDEDWKDRFLPLTWDELKQMEGKPVWVEESAENGLWWTYWVIWQGDNAVLPEETYGTTWNAYRKERL